MTVSRAFVVLLVCSLLSFIAHSIRDVPQKLEIAGVPRIDIVVEGHQGFLFQPERAMDWVWFAPTVYAKNLPGERQRWLIENLLRRGIAVAGIDVGETFGNPAGREFYQAFYRQLIMRGMSMKPCLLAQSRGGLMLYNWAIKHPQSVACIGGIYSIVNLGTWPDYNSVEFPVAAKSYEMPPEDFIAESANLSPLNHLGPLARAHIPILDLHGDADKIVSLQRNGGDLVQKYSELGGEARLIVIHGRGHEDADEFFESQELLEFLVNGLLR